MKKIEIFKLIDSTILRVNGKKVPTDSSYHYKYERTRDYYKKKCGVIASYIISHHYTKDDLKAYIYVYYITNTKTFWDHKIDIDDIKGAKLKYFSEDSLNRDKKIIFNINKETKFNSIEEYFKIQESGENYACILLLSKYISPMFYLKYMGCLSENTSENTSEKQSEKQKQMNNLMQVIKGENTDGKK
tara:strand:+ start:2913 stop:3476 length:564 start_codon:yes stop_codon:yes gene_type:complete